VGEEIMEFYECPHCGENQGDFSGDTHMCEKKIKAHTEMVREAEAQRRKRIDNQRKVLEKMSLIDRIRWLEDNLLEELF
jgi:hypothetical protein